MSGDSVYRVVLALSTEGNLSSRVGDVGARASHADESLRKLGESGRKVAETFSTVGESVGGALERAADRAIDLGASFAKAGLAAAVGLAVYGVGHLNNQLEQTEISIAAIAQAQGYTATFAQGMSAAGDEVAKMKQDIKTLPGDLGQLSAIFTTIATPAAQAHASLDQIRQLAGRTMLTASILSVPQEVASREMAQLLSGRAGAHNILGMRLGLVGDEAKKFNQLAPEARLARINEELGKYQGAADRFGQSFVANWTTLKDNIKYTLLAPATAPLFEHVKATVIEINGYFDAHKAQIDSIVHSVGIRLAQGWDSIVADVKVIAPEVERIVDKLAEMKPSDVAHRLEQAAGIVLGMKAAGSVLSAGSGLVMPAAKVAGYLAKSVAVGTGEAVAEAGGTAALGAAATETTAALGGTAAALGVTTATIATAGAALIAAGGAAVIAGGEVSALADASSQYHKDAVKASKDLATAVEHLTADLQPAASAVTNFTQHVGTEFTEFSANMLEGFHEFFMGWRALVPHSAFKDKPPDRSDYLPDDDAKFMGLRRLGEAGGLKLSASAITGAPSAASKGAAPKVNVNVQINVHGNDDPGRVARLTMREFEEFGRNPRSSRFAARWESPTHR